MATFTYPHVGITTKALQRRTVANATSTATTMLAPFMCGKGPDNQLVAIDSMSQFISTFGTLDYSKESQRQILNIGKWLGSGGRVLACRLVTTADSIKNSAFLTEFSTATAEQASYCWAIESGTSNAKGPEYVSVGIDSSKLSVTVGGITYIISLNNATIGTGEQYAHFSAFSASGFTYDQFFNDGLVGVSASVSQADTLILTKESHSFDTEINLVRPTSIAGKTAAAKTAYSAVYTDTNNNKLTLSANAKYYGEYYNNVKISVSSDGLETSKTGVHSMYFDVVVYLTEKGVTKAVEKYSGIEFDSLYKIDEASDYITDFKLSLGSDEITDLNSNLEAEKLIALKQFRSLTLTKSTAGADGDDDIESILVGELTEVLKNPLETPFDIMIDCGYSKQIKLDLIKLFCSTSNDINDVVRNDAFLYLTPYAITGTGRSMPTEFAAKVAELRPESGIIDGVDCDFSNMSIVDQFFKIEDIYSADSGKEVFVPSTIWYADLVASNDSANGVQWPVAGLTRGVIKGSPWINMLPTAAEKQEHFDEHLNYVEKDDRGMCLMTQLTGTVDDTELMYINKMRALLKMKRQIRLIGRQYLHEFNDRLTKNNLSLALNTYLSDWIQNRTLSYGNITLTDSTENQTLTDEEIEIGLDIKFTGTIEIISVNITVE